MTVGCRLTFLTIWDIMNEVGGESAIYAERKVEQKNEEDKCGNSLL